jgi:hypothetical protein
MFVQSFVVRLGVAGKERDLLWVATDRGSRRIIRENRRGVNLWDRKIRAFPKSNAVSQFPVRDTLTTLA